jgi:hypothetical protein
MRIAFSIAGSDELAATAYLSSLGHSELPVVRPRYPAARAPVAQWIEQRFPKPRALVRLRPGALTQARFRSGPGGVPH